MDNRRKRSGWRYKTIYILTAICIALAIGIVVLATKVTTQNANQPIRDSSTAQTSSSETSTDSKSGSEDDVTTPTPTAEATPEPLPPVTVISPDAIQSTYGYMERVSDGAVVLDKNSTQTMYPASMTKVMSVLVALENLPDLDEKLQISTETIAYCFEQHSSMAGFAEGEWVSVRDLLYGAMLPSGGEAVITLANRVAGSEAAFADMMNAKAAELGLTGTHFVNSTGLHDDNQYTTCVDMKNIFNAALQNSLFCEIASTPAHQCEATDVHPDGLVVYSTVFSHITNTTMENGAIIWGGKTGTTDEAGNCLVSFGDYNGQRYILVTALGFADAEGVQNNFADAITAYSALQ